MSGDLQDLLARVEAATGPDRELDAALAVALYQPEVWRPALRVAPNAVGCVVMTYVDADGRRSHGTQVTERYTANLGAVVTLAKRLGFYIRSEPRFHIDGERVDFISYALRPRWDDEWFDRGDARHADQVLSAVAALLKAKIAEPRS